MCEYWKADHENRYTNRCATAANKTWELQNMRVAEMSEQPISDFPVWSCGPRSPPSRGLTTSSLHTHTRAHAHTFLCFVSVCHPCGPPLSPVYRRVRSFTSPCFWCAGRAGRAGEEGARPHRQPGQEQPEQRGCGRTERRIGGRRAQKRRVTYQKKPLFSDRLGWCEGDTTTPVLKASIYPTNLHFVFFVFFLLAFYFILRPLICLCCINLFRGSPLCARAYFTALLRRRSSFIYLQRRRRRGTEGLSRKACSVIITQPLYRPLLRLCCRTWYFAGFGVRVPFGLPLKMASLH